MSKTRCRELVGVGDRLFSQRANLASLWQEIADHFYPERADFTTVRTLGEDFAAHLMSGYPALQRRELADQFGAMLRPRQKLWATLRAQDDRINEDQQAKLWLEAMSERMRRAMYERKAQFVRATKEGDNDFAAFGNAVIEPTLRRNLDGLLYRCWHLRDVAWCEDANNEIDSVHRCWKLPATTLIQYFPKTVAPEVRRVAEKEPYREFECRHIVVPSEQYDYGKIKNKEAFPFVSLFIDKDNDTIMEETPRRRLGYVIPRWQTVSGSQYGFSPAAIIGLPDARLIQQMTVTLLEASEKAVNPPMVATEEVVKNDIQLFAGGTTWVDREYDEKLGEALRPITQNLEGMKYGFEMVKDVREMLKQAFYLNKIQLPEIGHDMTAFETQERVKEYVRSVLPLFEPMEMEYNGGLCEETFDILLERGTFGGPDEMPEILRGADVRFQFESPLQQTADRAKAEAFKQALELTAAVSQLDPLAREELDIRKAFRDALDGVEVPADWKRDPKMVEELIAQRQEEIEAQQQAAEVAQGAVVAKDAGAAVKDFGAAEAALTQAQAG